MEPREVSDDKRPSAVSETLGFSSLLWVDWVPFHASDGILFQESTAMGVTDLLRVHEGGARSRYINLSTPVSQSDKERGS